MDSQETRLQKIKKVLNQLLFRLFKYVGIVFMFSLRAYNSFKKKFRLLGNILLSLLSAIICFGLIQLDFHIALEDEFNYTPFFIAIGSTLITILILTFSIAIIPIQRSIESFSKSISFIYRNDKATSLIFILISVFSLFSYLSALNKNLLGINISQALIVNIFLIGVTLDLLRWYHTRICKLLEPDYAIQKLVNQTSLSIRKFQPRTSFLSKISFYFLPRSEKSDKTPRDLEKGIYLLSPKIEQEITSKLSELMEISIKALSKNEVNTVAISVNAIADVGIHFIKARKDNLIYYRSQASNYLVSQSNIDNVLNNLYENILTIAQKSNFISNQNSSINCLRTIEKITNSITENILSKEVHQSRDMFFVPISYLANIIEDAQNKNLDEVVLQGCNILSQTLSKIYSKQHIIEIDYTVNDLYIKLVMKYIGTDKQAYGNKVLEIMMNRLLLLISEQPYNLNYTLKDIIEKIESIFPLALFTLKQKQKNLMYFDLSVPYNAADENSFLNFIRSSQSLNKVDENKWHINPYQHFSDYNHEISMHFRSLGEHNDLGDSVFLWHITYSIKEIIRIHFQLLQKPLTEIHNHIEELFDRITWYLSFFWVTLGRSEKINKNYTEEICDVICWTALSCYKEDFYKEHIIDIHKVIDICISNLSSVIKDYVEKGESKSSYDIADLILYLWFIRIVAVSKKENFRITKIDKALNELELTTGQEDYLDEALKLRYQQFLERVMDKRTLPIYDGDKSIGMLRELVDEKFYYII